MAGFCEPATPIGSAPSMLLDVVQPAGHDQQAGDDEELSRHRQNLPLRSLEP
ncbi:MAG TPA: hypothetical protein VI336_02005 [Candidatus Saccharimonadales bacterium]|nr:hypothetical protein [Candidatus Saccharimonadales bacterium]